MSAQETSGFEKNGIYVGASEVPDFNLDDVTFNGSTYYQSMTGNNEVMILPKLEPKSTIRAIGGYRLTGGSFEVSYERTNHEGTFLGQIGQATFQALNFDERIYALTRRRLQPYGLLGLSLPRLTVKDGAAVGDGSFRGFGLNSEAGATVSRAASGRQRRVPLAPDVVRQRRRGEPHDVRSAASLPGNG